MSDGEQGGAEEYGGDQDAEAPASQDQIEQDSERDQAEGESDQAQG